MTLGHESLMTEGWMGWQRAALPQRHQVGSSVIQGPSRSPTSGLPKVHIESEEWHWL